MMQALDDESSASLDVACTVARRRGTVPAFRPHIAAARLCWLPDGEDSLLCTTQLVCMLNSRAHLGLPGGWARQGQVEVHLLGCVAANADRPNAFLRQRQPRCVRVPCAHLHMPYLCVVADQSQLLKQEFATRGKRACSCASHMHAQQCKIAVLTCSTQQRFFEMCRHHSRSKMSSMLVSTALKL